MPKIISLPWLPWFDGLTLGPGLILLRHDATPDVLPHEMCHVRQMRSDGWLRWLWRYYGSRRWRLEYEAQAYAVSVANGADLEVCVSWLVGWYWLHITRDQGRAAIERHAALLGDFRPA